MGDRNMVKKLIEGGIIITMDKDRRIIEDGYIVIEDKKIKAVGKWNDVKDEARDVEEKISLKKRIIIPGIICSHTHLYGILLRGAPLKIKPPTDFMQILKRIWWFEDEAMNYDDAYGSALAASYEMLRSGTTLFADTYSGPNSIEGVLDYIEKGVREVGIRGILAFESTERRSVEEGDRGIKENVRFIKKLSSANDNKIFGMYSIHASFTVSDEHIKKVLEYAKKYPAPITIHTSEGLVDLYHNLERYGKRTVERLYDVGLLGPNTVLAHAVHVNDDELELIKKTDTKVAHNPMSNMLNAVGVSPVPKMLNLGITIGLGNDGFIFDSFENIRTAFLIHKLNLRDPRAMSPMQVLEMATINGAKLYGLEDKFGSIEVGKYADITVLDPKPAPTPVYADSAVGHIVYGLGAKSVDKVFIDGELVVDNGEVLTVTAKYVEEKLQKSSTELWRRLGIDI